MSGPSRASDQSNLIDINEQISHQVGTKRHYENLSWQLIRLLLSLIGFLISLFSILASVIASRGVSVFPDPEGTIDLNHAIQQLSEVGFLDDLSAAVLVSVLVFSIAILISVSIYDIFIKSLAAAFHLQQPRDLKFGASAPPTSLDGSNEDLFSSSRYPYLHNQDIVEDIQEDWEKCLKHLHRGTISFAIVAMIIAPSLILAESAFLLFSIGVLMVSLHNYLDSNSKYPTLHEIEKRRLSDLCLAISLSLLMISYVSFDYYPEISQNILALTVTVFPIVTVISTVIESVNCDKSANGKYIRRNGILFYSFLVVSAIISFAEDVGDLNAGDLPTFFILFAALFFPCIVGAFLVNICNMVIGWVKKTEMQNLSDRFYWD